MCARLRPIPYQPPPCPSNRNQVRFDTLGPAMEAGLSPTVVVDRPVIQQIFLKHGLASGTVRINSRLTSYADLGPGAGVKVSERK